MSDSNIGDQIAIYTLYNAPAADLQAICVACERTSAKPTYGGNKGYIHPAPQPQHDSVTAVVAYHRTLDKADGSWDPNYLAIAQTPEWREKGILAVTLCPSDFEGLEEEDEAQDRGYDAELLKPSAVGIIFINLQVGNTDWFEQKGAEQDRPGQPDSDD